MSLTVFKALVESSRSVRRFAAASGIDRELLLSFIDIARATPSAVNFQPIKYKIFCEKKELDDVFPRLKWAGLLKDKFAPQAPDERPEGYIAMFVDSDIAAPENSGIDVGICAQTIMLAARTAGLHGCMLAAFDKDSFRKDLSLPDNLRPVLILAFGKSAESIALEDAQNGAVAYYRNQDGIHRVPKRPLSEIVL